MSTGARWSHAAPGEHTAPSLIGLVTAAVLVLAQNDEVLFMNSRISGAPASFAYIYTPSLAMLGGTQ